MENKETNLAAMTRDELEVYALKRAAEADELQKQVEMYEEQLRLMKKKEYGKKAEGAPDGGWQASLFNEAEALEDPQAPEKPMEKIKVPAPKKKKQKGAKDRLLKNLPKTVSVYTLSAGEQVCPQCGGPLHEMTKNVRREIEVVPAKVQVHEHVIQTYSCRNCGKNAAGVPVVDAPAPAPSPLLNGSVLSPSLLAFVVCRKYANRDTLYKMEQDFHQTGLRISRQDISNWIMRTAQDYGEALYARMKETLVKETYIHADETPLQVLKEPGRDARKKSYMWVYRTCRESVPLILYEYAASRAGGIPEKFLQGYCGILQTDGYAGYNSMKNCVRTGCFAHVRRKFLDAAKAAAAGTAQTAMKGVYLCDGLFRLDAQAKALPADKREAYREKEVRPQMDGFFAWVSGQLPLARSGSSLARALVYADSQKEYLENYFEDVRVELSNNPAESAVRPFVMGRKNWLFCNSPKGARSSAVWYSIVVTAQANGLDPYRYIIHFLEQMCAPGRTGNSVPENLLPWSPDLPQECRAGKTAEGEPAEEETRIKETAD